MSFTLPANSHCPTLSAPSLPWRSRIPNLSCAAAIPRKAPFNLATCRYTDVLSESSADRRISVATNAAAILDVSEVSEDSTVALTADSDLSSADTEMAVPAAVAVGLGAVASAGAAVSTGVGEIADSPTPSISPVSDSPDADTSQAETSTSTKLSSPTPIPPHLLSPIPPSRPSVPPSLIGEGESSQAVTADDSLSVEDTFSPQSTDIASDDELAIDIEGGYLDGAEELASATSFGDIEPSPDSARDDTSEPDSEAAFLDALESAPVVSMGEVVDESVLGLSSDASAAAGIVKDGGAPSTSTDAAPVEGSVLGNADGTSPLPEQETLGTGQSKHSGGSFGRFFGGFIIGFAIVAALIILSIRVLRGTEPSGPTPPPEATTETE